MRADSQREEEMTEEEEIKKRMLIKKRQKEEKEQEKQREDEWKQLNRRARQRRRSERMKGLREGVVQVQVDEKMQDENQPLPLGLPPGWEDRHVEIEGTILDQMVDDVAAHVEEVAVVEGADKGGSQKGPTKKKETRRRRRFKKPLQWSKCGKRK
jgi:hypothetical protein